MKRLLAILLAITLLSLTACAKKVEEPAPASAVVYTEPAPKVDYRVALFVCGKPGSGDCFDSAQAGLEQLRDDGRISLDTVELDGDNTELWQDELNKAASTKQYDVIVCGTSRMAEAVKEAAYKNPRVMFILFHDNTDIGENLNVLNMTFRHNELGYLMGAFAASMTTQTELDGINPEPVIGFIGGEKTPVTNDYLVGYIEGALSVNPDIKVDTRYLNDETDPSVSKEYALSMIQKNKCDILWNVAGAAGSGASDAVVESGTWFLGSDTDRERYGSPALAARTITSGVEDVGKALIWLFDGMDEGREYWGKEVSFGLSSGFIYLVTDKNYKIYASDEAKLTVEEAKQAIAGNNEEQKVQLDSALEGFDVAPLRTSVRP